MKKTLASLKAVIAVLEELRLEYLETKDKTVWYSMIQLAANQLPPTAYLYLEL